MSETRILIADEDTRQRTRLKKHLETQGYLIVGEASDGIAAGEIITSLRPDVVLADINLPLKNGIELAQELQPEHIAPIILMAHTSTREIVQAARVAGVLGFIVKPIKESELMPCIEVVRARWVEQYERRAELVRLRNKIETRRVIERAKGYLMDTQGLAEADAFRKIQRLAMNSRKTMHEVAQAILLAQQLTP